MRRSQTSRPARFAALALLPFLAAAPAVAQYQTPDKVQDHTWTPDVPNMGGVAPAAPGVSTSAQTWKTPTVTPVVVTPETPKKVDARWKYATNGHIENTCTAGASVFELSPGCYDENNNVVDSSLCYGTPPYPTCKAWALNGGQGNCPTGWPTIGLPFVQNYEYASVGFMYDWKGTCYRSTITPYR